MSKVLVYAAILQLFSKWGNFLHYLLKMHCIKKFRVDVVIICRQVKYSLFYPNWFYISSGLLVFHHLLLLTFNRSSHLEVLCIKSIVENFANFTGKHLWHSLFFNQVAGMPAAWLKKILWHRCFPVNFAKLLKAPFLFSVPNDDVINLCGKCRIWKSHHHGGEAI